MLAADLPADWRLHKPPSCHDTITKTDLSLTIVGTQRSTGGCSMSFYQKAFLIWLGLMMAVAASAMAVDEYCGEACGVPAEPRYVDVQLALGPCEGGPHVKV